MNCIFVNLGGGRRRAWLAALAALAAASLPSAQAQSAPAGDLLRGNGAFERSSTRSNPWAGIDAGGKLRGFSDTAQVVLTSGTVAEVPYPSSVSAADLNGDKLPDLVVADATGFFWFYPNKGDAKTPKFNFGEIMPLWLTTKIGRNYQPSCSKLCLTDYNDDGKVDIVVGNFLGQIFLVPNTGSPSVPRFVNPSDPTQAAVATDDKGKLWGNFFSPAYTDWNGDGRKDMILGDGTYAANSIYLLLNSGTSQTPRFKPEDRKVLIRGNGREHLTPQVVDWNEDGKLDILTGEREGYVTIFLNQAENWKDVSFDVGTEVKIGGSSKMGTLSNPVPVDMNNDGLFDLVYGRTNGNVGLSLNTGSKGTPKFEKGEILAGTDPYPKFKAPSMWELRAPTSSTYRIFRMVGADENDPLTFEPNLGLPEGSKMAGKLEFVPPKGETFNQVLSIPGDDTYAVVYTGSVSLKPNTKYVLKYSVKGSGFSDCKAVIGGNERYVTGQEGSQVYADAGYGDSQSFSLGGSFSNGSFSFSYRKDKDKIDEKNLDKPVSFNISFEMTGRGTFYIDNVSLTQAQ